MPETKMPNQASIATNFLAKFSSPDMEPSPAVVHLI
jgi:hypothetical protein